MPTVLKRLVSFRQSLKLTSDFEPSSFLDNFLQFGDKMDPLDLNAAFVEESLSPTKFHPFFKPFIDQQIEMVTALQQAQAAHDQLNVTFLLSPDVSFDSTIELSSSPVQTEDEPNLSDLQTTVIQVETMKLEGSPVFVGDPAITQRLLEEKYTLEMRLAQINQYLGLNGEVVTPFENASEQFYIQRIQEMSKALVKLGTKTCALMLDVQDDEPTNMKVLKSSTPKREK